MNKKQQSKQSIATAVGKILKATLFVDANTNSSIMIYQPKAPKELKQFRRR